MQRRRCQRQTRRTLHMQHGIAESISRTQTLTLPALAVVGTRPPHPSPVFYPHHTTTQPLHHHVSFNQPPGWVRCVWGSTASTPLHPPVQPHGNSNESKRKERVSRDASESPNDSHLLTQLQILLQQMTPRYSEA